jgi:hypothetical protein
MKIFLVFKRAVISKGNFLRRLFARPIKIILRICICMYMNLKPTFEERYSRSFGVNTI